MSFALFLDIDGVLNTRTTVVGAPSGRTGIDESRVRLLKKALKQFGKAEIVLTSDWKLMRRRGRLLISCIYAGQIWTKPVWKDNRCLGWQR